LKYKLQEKEIEYVLQSEPHTSKCIFLDEEPVEHQEEYQGGRVERGLFHAGDGTEINADANAAGKIARKNISKSDKELFDELADGVESVLYTPKRIWKRQFIKVRAAVT
jgi:transposase